MLLGLQRAIDSICAFTILALGHSGLILKLNIAYTVFGAIHCSAQIRSQRHYLGSCRHQSAVLPIFLFLVQRIGQVDVLKPLAIYPRLAFACRPDVRRGRRLAGGCAGEFVADHPHCRRYRRGRRRLPRSGDYSGSAGLAKRAGFVPPVARLGERK